MARIVEIYEDAQLAKQQVESRKVFGWNASVELTDRGVFEVTFTRDESTARNAKLKELEDDFLQCSVASDYIERYNGYNVNKKKFKAFHPFLLLVVIYIIFSTLLQGGILTGLYALYKADPVAFVGSGISLEIDGKEGMVIDENWEYELDLEKLKLSGIASIFGITEKTYTVTLEKFVNIMGIYGIVNLAIAVVVLIWSIKKAIRAKTYYKAELAYVQNRKDLLNGKVDELEERMDDIILEVKRLKIN